jgi:hypothetical protein
MKTKIRILALTMVLLLAVYGAALANGGVELPRWALGGGAADAAGGDVTLLATLGQPVVGIVSGGDVTVGQGFWRGGAPTHTIFLPLVMRG